MARAIQVDCLRQGTGPYKVILQIMHSVITKKTVLSVFQVFNPQNFPSGNQLDSYGITELNVLVDHYSRTIEITEATELKKIHTFS